jgi:hypothetical protein
MAPERQDFIPEVENLKAARILKEAELILFDGDQILLNSKVPVINEVNRILRTHYREDAIDSWDAVLTIALRHGVRLATATKFNQRIWDSPRILGESTFCRGAIPLTLKLSALGKELMVVTSRPPWLYEATHASIAEYYPWIISKNIKIREMDDPREGLVFKVETCWKEKADVVVEDQILQAIAIRQLAPDCKIILVNANVRELDERLDPAMVTLIESLAPLVDLI